MKKSLLMSAAALLSLGFASNAMAQSCTDLDSNPEWTLQIQMLGQDVQYENYDAALEKANKLSAICSTSPVLNYTISKLYAKKGDADKEKYYLQLATRNTKEFAVDPNTLEQMWADRIYAEHPESKPENVEQLKTQLKQTQLELTDLKASSASQNPESPLAVEIGLWTSVGIGGAGVLFSLIGGIMVAAMDSPITIDPDDATRAKIDTKYSAAWGLVGAGIAMSIAGAAGAGYFGYRYVKLNDSVSASLQLSPNGIGIAGTF